MITIPLSPREATEDKDQLRKQETVRVVSPPLSRGRDGSPEDCGKEGKCRKGERSWEKWFRHLAQEWSPRGTESERNKQAEERLSGGPCGVWGDHRVGAGQSLLTVSNSFRFSPFQAQAGLRFPAPWWLRGYMTTAGHKLSGSDRSLLDRTKSFTGFPASPSPHIVTQNSPQATKGGHRS